MLSRATLISRASALLILLGLIVMPLRLGFIPLVETYRETTESLDEKETLLKRFEAELAGQPGLQARIAALHQEHKQAGLYLEGASEAAAAASLQERIGAIANRSRADLRSVQALPSTDEEGMRRLSLRVVMSATVPQLFDVIYAIESDKPLAFIDNFEIEARPISSVDKGSEEVGALLVRFEVYGFLSPRNSGESA